MAASTVRLRNVTLHYGGDTVVREANLDVRQGETQIILGPSGVGKTTILRAMLGLLRPETGQVFIDDQEITHLPERELVKVRLRMAMVFQGGALFDSMTVGENVSFRLREHGLASPEEIESRVLEALSFVGLSGAVKLKPAQLSGGMKKRIGLARSIITDPALMLYDEPTTGLDPITSKEISELILNLQKKLNMTSIVVTHDLICAEIIADRAIFLRDSKIAFEGKIKELTSSNDPFLKNFFSHELIKV